MRTTDPSCKQNNFKFLTSAACDRKAAQSEFHQFFKLTPLIISKPKIRTFKENELTLAGFDDGLFDEGGQADAEMLAGLNRAKELGQTAPGLKT